MQATNNQKRIIHMYSPTPETKEDWVQWATNDNEKTSCNDLSFTQANLILVKLGKTPHKAVFRASFDKNNSKHKYILSLCIQYGWYKQSGKFGKVADLDKLNEWMYTSKCPVQKALKKMSSAEVSKVIIALESFIKNKYK